MKDKQLIEFIQQQIERLKAIKKTLADSPQSSEIAIANLKGYVFGYLQGAEASGVVFKYYAENVSNE